MKRDMDIVREILRSIEARPEDDGNVAVDIPGRSRDQLRLHLQVMEEAGLVEGVTMTSQNALCERLTWAGYDFIEATRRDSVWEKAKTLTLEKTGGLALTALSEAVKVVVKAAITGPAY